MKPRTYTPELAAEGERMYNAIESTGTDRQHIVSLMVDTFINGMMAQKMLDQKRQTGQEQGNSI